MVRGDDLRSSQVRQMLEDISDEAFSEPSPLLMSRAADILGESGRADMIGDEQIVQTLWDEFRFNTTAFTRKGSKASWEHLPSHIGRGAHRIPDPLVLFSVSVSKQALFLECPI